MLSSATRRLIKDLQKFQKDQNQFIVTPLTDDLMLWTATFEGAPDTIWEGGLFTLKLVFNERYPNTPPKIKFLNKMFHPNIYNDGRICLDMIYNQWSPIYDVWAILTAIKTLITDPNTQSPANIQAGNIFRENKVLYQYRVKVIVQKSLQFMPQGEQIIKETEKQKKIEREAEQAKTEKLQKQRRQRQSQIHIRMPQSSFSSQPKSMVVRLGKTSTEIYNTINKSEVQQNIQSFFESSQEGSSENIHTEDESLKEVFLEQRDQMEAMQNKVVQTAAENIKKDQNQAAEAVIPVIIIAIKKIEENLEEGQVKQSIQEMQTKQDQPIMQKVKKQQNEAEKVEADKNQQQQDEYKRNQSTNNQFQDGKYLMEQEQQQQQLESEHVQSEKEYQQYTENEDQGKIFESQQEKQ